MDTDNLSTYSSYTRAPNGGSRMHTNPATLAALGLISFEKETVAMKKYPSEPWFNFRPHARRFEIGNYDDNGSSRTLADFSPEWGTDKPISEEEAIEAAQRAVLCVNACAGLETASLKNFGVGGIFNAMEASNNANRALGDTIAELSTKLVAAESQPSFWHRVRIAFIGAVLTALVLVPAGMAYVDTLDNEIMRMREQYKDCRMIGDYPTNADMLPGNSGQ